MDDGSEETHSNNEVGRPVERNITASPILIGPDGINLFISQSPGCKMCALHVAVCQYFSHTTCQLT